MKWILTRSWQRLRQEDKMNPDLKHLKWKLINQEGLSPEQAQKRIDDLKAWDKKMKKEKVKKWE